MENINESRIEKAKQRLREKLSYESFLKIPKYKKLTPEQYEGIINSIEVICMVLLESYVNTTNT